MPPIWAGRFNCGTADRSAPAEPRSHEFERYPILAVFRVQASAQAVVEVIDVHVPETADLVDVPAALERHLVQCPEHVFAGCLRELEVIGSEAAEGVDGESLLDQGAFEQLDDAASDRAQVSDAHVGEEEREQCAGMDDEQALAAVEPEQVRVPVVLAGRRVDERDALAEQVEAASSCSARSPVVISRVDPASLGSGWRSMWGGGSSRLATHSSCARLDVRAGSR